MRSRTYSVKISAGRHASVIVDAVLTVIVLVVSADKFGLYRPSVVSVVSETGRSDEHFGPVVVVVVVVVGDVMVFLKNKI